MVIVEHSTALQNLIEHNIGTLEPNTQVFVTGDDDAALAYLQTQPVETLLIDMETHSATNFELMELAHRVSPKTRIVLMSTLGENKIKAKLQRLNLSNIDFIDKSAFLTELLEFDGR